jgi:hypothetical protein
MPPNIIIQPIRWPPAGNQQAGCNSRQNSLGASAMPGLPKHVAHYTVCPIRSSAHGDHEKNTAQTGDPGKGKAKGETESGRQGAQVPREHAPQGGPQNRADPAAAGCCRGGAFSCAAASGAASVA